MKSYFQQFVEQNKPLFWSKKKKYILITDREKVLSNISSIVTAAAISKKFDLAPIVLSPFNNKDRIDLFKSFGVKKFIITFSLKKLSFNFNYLKAFYYLLDILFIFFFKKNFFQHFIDNYSLKKIKIGCYVYFIL